VLEEEGKGGMLELMSGELGVGRSDIEREGTKEGEAWEGGLVKVHVRGRDT
jgi:hypothetical protein